jgi:hypothetical protein
MRVGRDFSPRPWTLALSGLGTRRERPLLVREV